MNIKNLWNPRVFLQWLDKNKFSKQNKYHNEEAELKKVKAVVISINNQKKASI